MVAATDNGNGRELNVPELNVPELNVPGLISQSAEADSSQGDLSKRGSSPGHLDTAAEDLRTRAFRRRSTVLPPPGSEKPYQWLPIQLRSWWMLFNIILLLVIAIGIEVIYVVNRNDHGWQKPGWWDSKPDLHILWTAIPGLIAFVIVFNWEAVNASIQQLQPYIEMAKLEGGSADRTVLLDYSRSNIFLVNFEMIRNGHYIPMICNCLYLIALLLSPLASALFYLDVPPPDVTQALNNVNVQAIQVQPFGTFINFDAAAGWIKSSTIYNVLPPPFVRFLPGATWTASQTSFATSLGPGQITARTICLRSTSSCASFPATIDNTNPLLPIVTGSNGTCSFSQPVNASLGWIDPQPFGVATAQCTGWPVMTELSPLAFWRINGTSLLSTICSPQVSIQKADVLLNSTTNSLLLVQNQENVTAADVPGVDLNEPPWNGFGYNALTFTLPLTALHMEAHMNMSQFSVGHAINQFFLFKDPTGTSQDVYTAVAEDTYAHYLGLVAQKLYFSPSNSTTTGSFRSSDPRIFVSSLSSHLIAVCLLIIAIFGILIHVIHSRQRQNMTLSAPPGSVAAAVSMAGRSELPDLVNAKDTEEKMKFMLSDLHFGLDPATGQVRVEDRGYTEVPATASLPTSPLGNAPDSQFAKAAKSPRIIKFGQPSSKNEPRYRSVYVAEPTPDVDMNTFNYDVENGRGAGAGAGTAAAANEAGKKEV